MSKYHTAYECYELASKALHEKNWKGVTVNLQLLTRLLVNLEHVDGIYRFGTMYTIGVPDDVREAIDTYHEGLQIARDPKRKAKLLHERNASTPEASSGSKSCLS